MKKLTFISLFIFWAIITAVLVTGLILRNNNTTAQSSIQSQSQAQSQVQNQNQSISNGSINLTVQEVAKHNSASDCWLIVSGKVYDVTNYLGVHPGGAGTIIPYCGQDATQAFKVDVRHSSTAGNILANYYLGDLNQSVPQQTIENTSSSAPTPPPNSFRRNNREYDD
jgi:cytochrome b involved in lipid metabolism